jgi:hypothetical protein
MAVVFEILPGGCDFSRGIPSIPTKLGNCTATEVAATEEIVSQSPRRYRG